jgi:hypothetical protein
MSVKFWYAVSLFALLHILVWFAANTQFISEEWKLKSLYLSVTLAIPISIVGYFGTRFAYEAFDDSVWAARFLAFGISYLVFPILTYYLLGESMFTMKTILCCFLSFVIISIQIFL